MDHPEKRYGDGLPPTDYMRNLLMSYNNETHFRNLNYKMFTISRGPESQVFCDIDYLRQHWGNFLNVLSVTPEAYGYQTAILLQK